MANDSLSRAEKNLDEAKKMLEAMIDNLKHENN